MGIHLDNLSAAADGLKGSILGFANAMGPAGYQAAGEQVRCTHCQGTLFQAREILLNTAGASLLNLDWLNKSGTALVCENCGLIQWFGKQPDRSD